MSGDVDIDIHIRYERSEIANMNIDINIPTHIDMLPNMGLGV